MATHRATSGEILDLASLGSKLKDARTTALVKSETFEAVRLIVHAGADIKAHKVDGPITLHCLEGRVQLGLPDKIVELSSGEWLYLEGGVEHSLKGIEDTALLLTIFFPSGPGIRARDEATVGTKSKQTTDEKLSADLALDAMLNEGLMDTFPASDPVSISNPSTGVGITRRDRFDREDR